MKRVKYVDDLMILYPGNLNYQPHVCKADEAKILGQVVKVEFEPE